MDKFKIKVTPIWIVLFLSINFNLNIFANSKHDHCEHNSNTVLPQFQQTVYVCMGEYSIAYHSSPECRGLNNCSTKIYETTSDYAITSLGRKPCCICWNVNSYQCATDKEQKSSTYISPLPADVFIQGAIQKQRNFDAGNAIVQNEINNLYESRNQLFRNCDLTYFDQLSKNAINTINTAKNLDLSFQSHVDWAVRIVRSVSNNQIVQKAISSSVAYNSMAKEYNSLSYTDQNSNRGVAFYNYFMSWYNSSDVSTNISYRSFYSF